MAQSYFWYFDDGNFSYIENPLNTFSEEAEYKVYLVAANECGTDTAFANVDICIAPDADFDFNQNGFEFRFYNNSSNYDSCYWNFGDGFGSININPLHTYSAEEEYIVSLYTSNNCGVDSLIKTIEVSMDTLRKDRLLLISPNPTTGILKIELINVDPVDMNIDLYTYHGKLIKSFNIFIDGEATIDLSELTSGIYVLKFTSELINNRFKKVIKLF